MNERNPYDDAGWEPEEDGDRAILLVKRALELSGEHGPHVTHLREALAVMEQECGE